MRPPTRAAVIPLPVRRGVWESDLLRFVGGEVVDVDLRDLAREDAARRSRRQ